ncbi:hypothetical protein F4811DRAFT_523920 [Daldinia bambusicola]|nr:hypothetical protein F4811DRAFT_523920 [Daldinia bambusicola]
MHVCMYVCMYTLPIAICICGAISTIKWSLCFSGSACNDSIRYVASLDRRKEKGMEYYELRLLNLSLGNPT